MEAATYETSTESVWTHEAQSYATDLTGIDPETWLSPPKVPFDPDPDAERRWLERITQSALNCYEDD